MVVVVGNQMAPLANVRGWATDGTLVIAPV